MSNKAIEVLDKQISEIESKIHQNTYEVGELFLQIYGRKLLTNFSEDNFKSSMKDMDKMPPLIAKDEKYKTELSTLQKSKNEILKSELSEN